MSIRTVAGIDCSTQSTKVVVIDVASGELLAEGRGEHDVRFAPGNQAETDPRSWWEALRTALAATGRAGEIDAIAVGGQQHGLVVVDDAGAPLRPAMLWCDLRSTEQAEALVAGLGGPERAAELTGSLPIASFTAPKWAWLRAHEPATAAGAAGLLLPHDWLTRQLTGRAVTDRGDASGTSWWSPGEGRYLQEVLDLPAVALDPALLPEVLGPTDVAGEVTPAAAAELGLRAGIPVGPGTGDNAAAALGLGVPVGRPVLSLGTSGTTYVRATTPSADPTGLVAGFADAAGGYLPLVCTQNCTLAVDAVSRLLGLDREQVADDTGVVMLPYLEGERTPYLPAATGSIIGMRLTTTPEELLLAAYRGAAATLLGGVERLPGVLDDEPLVLIGGGARGRTWQRVVRELSGRSLLIPELTELVAMGAAVQAAAVATGEDLEAVAARWDTMRGQVIDPLPRRDDVLQRFQHVADGLEELNTAPLPG